MATVVNDGMSTVFELEDVTKLLNFDCVVEVSGATRGAVLNVVVGSDSTPLKL